jgi:hypothetical protein
MGPLARGIGLVRGGVMRQLWEFGYCLRLLRARMRFGRLSRAPLRFLRIEVREDVGRCDWSSEEGRVGEEGRIGCRSRWSPYH